MGKHTITGAIKTLQDNGISVGHKTIGIPLIGVGIKLWGLIDFLVNHHGYQVMRS
jgi:hypothetical protein